jgi:hypothetical protein
VTPKPAPELPGFGEEVRDINFFVQFGLYHSEGEVAAKLGSGPIKVLAERRIG